MNCDAELKLGGPRIAHSPTGKPGLELGVPQIAELEIGDPRAGL